MHRRVPTSEARKDLAEIVNRAHYSGEITFLTKHGKDLAAVVPANAVPTEDEVVPRKKPSSKAR